MNCCDDGVQLAMHNNFYTFNWQHSIPYLALVRGGCEWVCSGEKMKETTTTMTKLATPKVGAKAEIQEQEGKVAATRVVARVAWQSA
jgi:hypothetical protein